MSYPAKNFHLSEDIVDAIITSFKSKGLYVDAPDTGIALPDPKDAVFYEVTMEGKKQNDTYLVTGNIKHFPRASFIVTPRQMLDIILSGME